MNGKKQTPILTQRETKNCPVCGRTSYSSNGIHPQCAVAQADAPRRQKLLEEKRRLANEKKKGSVRKSTSKKCPDCEQLIPIRTNLCTCGHSFAR